MSWIVFTNLSSFFGWRCAKLATENQPFKLIHGSIDNYNNNGLQIGFILTSVRNDEGCTLLVTILKWKMQFAYYGLVLHI